MAQLGEFQGRDLKQAVGVLIAFVGSKKSLSAAPATELERVVGRELPRRRRWEKAAAIALARISRSETLGRQGGQTQRGHR